MILPSSVFGLREDARSPNWVSLVGYLSILGANNPVPVRNLEAIQEMRVTKDGAVVRDLLW